MLNILKQLLEKWACKHKWGVYAKRKVENSDSNGNMGLYYMHTFICEKCGKFKRIKI